MGVVHEVMVHEGVWCMRVCCSQEKVASSFSDAHENDRGKMFGRVINSRRDAYMV